MKYKALETFNKKVEEKIEKIIQRAEETKAEAAYEGWAENINVEVDSVLDDPEFNITDLVVECLAERDEVGYVEESGGLITVQLE